MKRIILSPHNDDAVLSLGGSIAKWVEAGDDVLVINFMTISNYVNPATKKAFKFVAEQRAAEEAAASKLLGYSYNQLGFKDKPLRGDDISKQVIEAIKRTFTSYPSEVYAPMSGTHGDHRLVRDCAESVIPAEHLHFYEDLPYCLNMVDQPTGKRPVLIEINPLRKREAVLKYESQVDSILEFMVRAYAHGWNDNYYERIWE